MPIRSLATQNYKVGALWSSRKRLDLWHALLAGMGDGRLQGGQGCTDAARRPLAQHVVFKIPDSRQSLESLAVFQEHPAWHLCQQCHQARCGGMASEGATRPTTHQVSIAATATATELAVR